uniref:Protein couch potato n=1 Tax=Sipha flava TaxID=143950 RepID=A0A2S2RBS1_9HEMI
MNMPPTGHTPPLAQQQQQAAQGTANTTVAVGDGGQSVVVPGMCNNIDSVGPGEEEVRTLFVSGLPMDAKPRELYLLFRAYEGYEGSLLKVTSKNGKTASPVGFVTFQTRAGAEAAKQDLQVCFILYTNYIMLFIPLLLSYYFLMMNYLKLYRNFILNVTRVGKHFLALRNFISCVCICVYERVCVYRVGVTQILFLDGTTIFLSSNGNRIFCNNEKKV